MTGTRRVAWRLSAAVAGLLAGVSAVGVAWRGLYQDTSASTVMFRAYDLGTLTLAVPVCWWGPSSARGAVRTVLSSSGPGCWPTSSAPTRTTSSARR